MRNARVRAGIGLATAGLMTVACSGNANDPFVPDPDCASACDTLPDAPMPVGRWIPATPLPQARMRLAATVFDGDLVVAGGIIGPGQHTASVVRLRPGSIEWEDMADLPLQLSGLDLVVVRDTLYAVGGDGPFFTRPEQALYAYDAEEDQWHSRELIPDWRTGTQALPRDGMLWLTGGPVVRNTDHGPLVPGDTTLLYTPVENRWTYAETLPTERWNHQAVQTDDGRSFIVGGEHGRFPDVMVETNVFDHDTGTWSTIEDPWASDRIGAAFAFPYVHVVGGNLFPTFHRGLDVRDVTWTRFPDLPRETDLSVTVAWQDALWVLGGAKLRPGYPIVLYDTVYRLDLSDLGLPKP